MNQIQEPFQDLKTALESKGQIPASEVAEQLLSRIDTTGMFGSDEDLNMTNLGVDVAAALNEIKNMDIAQGENTVRNNRNATENTRGNTKSETTRMTTIDPVVMKMQ